MYDRTARRIIAIATVVCISIVMVYYLFFSKYAIFPLMGRPVHHYIRIEKEGLGDVLLRNVKSVKPYLFKAENGTEVSVVLRAKPYWEIKKVELRGADTKVIEPPINTTTYSFNFTLLANTTIHVVFARIPEFELEVIVDGEGSVDVSSTRVLRGRTIEVSIEPAEGWFIESVRLDGEDLGAVDRLSIGMWSDRVLEVRFHRWAYLNITVVGNATVEVEGAEFVDGLYRAPEGSNVTVSIKCPSSLREDWFIRRILLDGTVLFEFNRSRPVERRLVLNLSGCMDLSVELGRVEYVVLKLEVLGNGTVWVEDYRRVVEDGVYTVEKLKPLKVYFKTISWFWPFRKAQIVGRGEILELHKDCIVVVLEEDSTIRMTFERRKIPEGVRGYITDRPVSRYRKTRITKVNRTMYIIEGEDYIVDAYIPLDKEWYRVKVKVILEVIPLTESGKRSPTELFLGGFIGADEEKRPRYNGVCIRAIGSFEAMIELWREEWVYVSKEFNITCRPKIKYRVEFNGTLDPDFIEPIYPSGGGGGADVPMGYNIIYVYGQDATIPIDAWVRIILIILELE